MNQQPDHTDRKQQHRHLAEAPSSAGTNELAGREHAGAAAAQAPAQPPVEWRGPPRALAPPAPARRPARLPAGPPTPRLGNPPASPALPTPHPARHPPPPPPPP